MGSFAIAEENLRPGSPGWDYTVADSSISGKHLECPTCFQRIVVPQAPASDDTKLILSAAQVTKPREVSTRRRQ